MKIYKNSMMKKSRLRNRKTSMKKKNWFQSVSSSTLLLNIQTQLMTSSCTGEYLKKISVSGPPQTTDTFQRTQSGSVIRLHARPSSNKILRAQHLGLFTSTFNGKRRWNQQLNQLVLCSWNRKKMRGITMAVKTIKSPSNCQWLLSKAKMDRTNNCKLLNITITTITTGKWEKYWRRSFRARLNMYISFHLNLCYIGFMDFDAQV